MIEERVKKIKRLVATTSLLCVIAIYIAMKVFPPQISIDMKLLYISLFLGFVFTIILYLIPAEKYGTRKLFYILIFVSIILISSVVYFGGGMRSQFFGLYLVPLIFSSVYQQVRGALYTTFLILVFYSIIFYLNPGNYNEDENLDILSYHLRFFFITAFFSGYLIKKEIEYRNKIKDLFLKIIKVSTKILDIKEIHPKGHAEEVADLSLKVAENMKLTSRQKRDLQVAALFHDIGISEINENIFAKPNGLTQEEFQQFKNHHILVEELLSDIKELKTVSSAIRHSHERYDGSGYPDGLSGEEIPLLSRIISVCDAYSAMTKERTYRKSLTKEEAIEEIKRNSGTQFDPKIVDAFLKII